MDPSSGYTPGKSGGPGRLARQESNPLTGDSHLKDLISRLHSQHAFPDPVTEFRLLETHISWVALTGEFAYKFKKPVDLGFLDFSTLEKRRFYCHEELRLNRRLASDLYLDVVEIYGSPEHPVFKQIGNPIEYAVKMRQFPEQCRLDHVADRGELRPGHIDLLASDIADFHTRLPPAKPGNLCGTPGRIGDRMLENFQQIESHTIAEIDLPVIRRLKEWTIETLGESQEDFEIRCREGFVRECHGDMHLGNMVLLNDRIRLFDCLEFAKDLRWIDILSDVAFLLMDLDYRELTGFGRRFLNRYLEATNDYLGLPVLIPYLAYRAMVRAKVAAISFGQHRRDQARAAHFMESLIRHASLAEQYADRSRIAPIILMHGLSGSGKSYLSARLVEAIGGIRIRSDIERKRLLGSRQPETTGKLNEGAYTAEITRKTYERLLALAYGITDAGFPVIVDATFLQTDQRGSFLKLARTARLPVVILDLMASEDTLKNRIHERMKKNTDVSEATLEVLEHQIREQETLTPEEREVTVPIDTGKPVDIERLASTILRRSP